MCRRLRSAKPLVDRLCGGCTKSSGTTIGSTYFFPRLQQRATGWPRWWRRRARWRVEAPAAVRGGARWGCGDGGRPLAQVGSTTPARLLSGTVPSGWFAGNAYTASSSCSFAPPSAPPLPPSPFLSATGGVPAPHRYPPPPFPPVPATRRSRRNCTSRLHLAQRRREPSLPVTAAVADNQLRPAHCRPWPGKTRVSGGGHTVRLAVQERRARPPPSTPTYS